MKTETDEKIMIPNNLFYKKSTKINSKIIAVICYYVFIPSSLTNPFVWIS
jgi:hypothetical protein